MNSGIEKKVKDKLKLLLKARNAYFFMPVQMGLGATTVDFLVCIQGFFIGIETKAEGKVPTPRQRTSMQDIERAGGIAVWGDNAERIMETIDFKIKVKKGEDNWTW